MEKIEISLKHKWSSLRKYHGFHGQISPYKHKFNSNSIISTLEDQTKKKKQLRRNIPCLCQDTELYSHAGIYLEEKSPEPSNQDVRTRNINMQRQ